MAIISKMKKKRWDTKINKSNLLINDSITFLWGIVFVISKIKVIPHFACIKKSGFNKINEFIFYNYLRKQIDTN